MMKQITVNNEEVTGLGANNFSYGFRISNKINSELYEALNAKTPHALDILSALGLAPIITTDRLKNLELNSALPYAPKTFGELIDLDARVFESYSLREHTYRVLNQFIKYFSSLNLDRISKADFLLMLTLHDCGKALPSETKDQHKATVQVMEGMFVEGLLPLSDKRFELIRGIVDGDPLGRFAKGCGERRANVDIKKMLYEEKLSGKIFTLDDIHQHLISDCKYKTSIDSELFDKTRGQIIQKAEKLEIAARDLLHLYTVFYQSDTTSYTIDSLNVEGEQGSPSLEDLYAINERFTPSNNHNLFIFSEEKGRLLFAPGLEQLFSELEQSLVV